MPPEPEFWVDSQISPVIAKWLLERRGFVAKSSYSLKLTAAPDLEIYHLARQQQNVVIISKDTDFTNIIQSFGSPPKLINVVLGNCTNEELWKALNSQLDEILRLLFEENIDIIELK